MSCIYCEFCAKIIDTDFDLEHLINEQGMCMKQEEVIVLRLGKLATDISSGDLQLNPDNYKQQILKKLP